MGKKKAATTAKQYADRKGSKSSADIATDMESLKEIDGQLKAIAKGMADHGIQSLTIDGFQKFARAVKLLKEYCANASHSLNRARIRGDTGTRV